MVKSAVRAMDAVQAWARERGKGEVKQFVVSGASKRGWTTWLTGAVDNRVIAIAPMGIVMLNMATQGPNQFQGLRTTFQGLRTTFSCVFEGFSQ